MSTLIEKEFEVKFTVKCKVEKLGKAEAARDLEMYSNVDELLSNQSVWLDVERQQRLFADLLKNKTELERYFHRIVILEIAEEVSRLENDQVDSSAILFTLSQNMKKVADVKFFGDTEKEGFFSENTDHISERVTAKVLSIEITDKN